MAVRRRSHQTTPTVTVAATPPWPTVSHEVVLPPGAPRQVRNNLSHEERYRMQRESLLRIARELANTQSPESVQISEIVAAAGISRRTFYEHFPTKEACFAEVLRSNTGLVLAQFRDAAEGALALGPTATFQAVIAAWANLVGEDRMLSERAAFGLWTEGVRPGSPFGAALSGMIDAVTKLFVVAATRLGSPLDPRLLGLAAQVQVSGLIGVIITLHEPDSPVSEADLARMVAVALGFSVLP